MKIEHKDLYYLDAETIECIFNWSTTRKSMNCIIILGKVTFFEIFLTKKVLKKKFENKLPAEKSNLKIVILKLTGNSLLLLDRAWGQWNIGPTFLVRTERAVVSLAAVVRVGPELASHQRLLTRTTHSIPFVQWTNKIRA